jgi:hypothetical protein
VIPAVYYREVAQRLAGGVLNMIPIVRACTDPKYRRIIEVSASQMGKPTVYWPGPRLEGDPVLILYVGPTRSGCGEVDRAPILGDGSLRN